MEDGTLYEDYGFNDSGKLAFDFGNKGNQSIGSTFNSSNNELDEMHNIVVFFKGLIITRFMPSFYILIILISLPLNGLAVVTFSCRIQASNPAVIYMCHLACVDLLFTLLLPLKIHYHLNTSNWVFGEAPCRALTVTFYWSMYCSILLMMCMSVDRLLAIAFPIASRSWRTTRNASCICVLVWLLVLTGVSPLLSMPQTFSIENLGITCFDFFEYTSLLLYVSTFFFLISVYFLLPLVVILVSYSIIIYVLCAKVDHLATSSSSLDKRRKAVIMTTAVLAEFVVCFAPTNCLLLYHMLCLFVYKTNGYDTYSAYMLAVGLGSVSVVLDPLLYYYGSSQYRQQICFVFRGRKEKNQANTQSNRSETQNISEQL